MKRFLILAAVAACTPNDAKIKPEPVDFSTSSGSGGAGGAGGTSAAGVGGGSPGGGGAGGSAGATCDVCFKSGNRIKIVGHAVTSTDGLADVQRSHYHDTDLGIDCFETLADDGIVRCLPLTSAIFDVYTDPECTARILRLHKPTCVSAPQTPIMVAREVDDGDACTPNTYSVFNVGPIKPEQLTDVYTKSGTFCFKSAASYEFWVYHDYGPYVQSATFQALSVSPL